MDGERIFYFPLWEKDFRSDNLKNFKVAQTQERHHVTLNEKATIHGLCYLLHNNNIKTLQKLLGRFLLLRHSFKRLV